MTSLRRAKNNDWFARKGIPADLRDSYAATFGVRQEERFRLPSATPAGQAKAAFGDWLAEVEGRIARLQSLHDGTPQTLTARERRELCGQWYAWFTRQHEDDPGPTENWDNLYDVFQDVVEAGLERPEEGEEDRETAAPAHMRRIRAKLAECSRMMSFLAETNMVLSADDQAALLDDVRPDFMAALRLLRARSKGNYRPDTYAARFPIKDTSRTKPSGLTVWKLFELWIRETKPKGSTVTRWRAVFQNLDEVLAGKDVTAITVDDAVEWKSTLVTEKRTVKTANVVWLGATRSVFGWAKQERKIVSNPFEGLSFARVKEKPVMRDKDFTVEEWRTLLRAALESEPGDRKPGLAAAIRWLPWLCAYTGARSGEIAQLRGQDVQQHRDGFWTITITPDAGTVKTNKVRTVPLHEHLVEMAFPAFARARGPGPLFYDGSIVRKAGSDDVTKPVAPPAQMVRQRMSEWAREVGVTDKNISPNHAWRHTFKRRAARFGLEPRIRDGMCGHAARDVASHYETASVEDLAKAMERFERYDLGRP